MTEVEAQELRELGEEIAAAERSPWEPGTIARAWATPDDGALALTMQGWIDLSAARSPILLDRYPETPAELHAAAASFGLANFAALNPLEAVRVTNEMRRTVRAAFAAALKMQPPAVAEMGPEDDGFGVWMPILTALVTQCGLGVQEALALRVDQAFTLFATHLRNQGWHLGGTSYALRDVADADQPSNGQP